MQMSKTTVPAWRFMHDEGCTAIQDRTRCRLVVEHNGTNFSWTVTRRLLDGTLGNEMAHGRADDSAQAMDDATDWADENA